MLRIYFAYNIGVPVGNDEGQRWVWSATIHLVLCILWDNAAQFGS